MNTNTQIQERLAALRKAMQTQKVDACIIPSSDAHQSEYTPAHWKIRSWISGFTGSAGIAVVTLDKACLWTDSRYFLQAEKELEGTGFILQKEGISGTPSLQNWLCSQLASQSTIGIDGFVFNVKEVQSMQQVFQASQLSLKTDFTPFDEIWKDRPSIPGNKIFLLPENISGESTSSKIHRIKEKISQEKCNAILLCSLDEIAWTFNMRGNDVPCNPVAVAYGIITPEESVVFINPQKVTKEITEEFQQYNIKIADYNRLPTYLSNADISLKIRIDANKTNFYIFDVIRSLAKKNNQIQYELKYDPSPVAMLKTLKNATEIAGFHDVMKKDGVALLRVQRWIEQSLKEGKTFTETDVESKLKECRSQQSHYVGESFDAIVGYGGNGAIVHYHAQKETASVIRPEGLLLIDTGGQYLNGTTDITRTYALGKVSEQMKHDYTLVLKGHIGIATAKFPKGTRGSQLDILARRFMWNEGATYLHGTGHGIGHFLNVHEGPQNIRLEENPVTLELGMVTSNEPGFYRTGEYGIRIENLVLVTDYKTTEFGIFYQFETITLFPIDTSLIQTDILTAEEKQWLNNYHRMVEEKLSPLLESDEVEWLREKTKRIY